MSKITRAVILDLLPLYLAGEVSADTRALVESYLESDEELRALARSPDSPGLLQNAPIPLNQEDQMKALLETKRLMLWRTISLSIIISIGVLSLLSLALLAVRMFAF